MNSYAVRKMARKIDEYTGSALRRTYWFIYKKLMLADLWSAKRTIRIKVGKQLFKEAARFRIAVLPNQLQRAGHLYQGGYAIEKIFLACDLNVEPFNPLKTAEVIFNWQDLTHNILDPEKYVQKSYNFTGRPFEAVTVNFFCDDISKRNIGTRHESVIGYPLDVDPTNYSGPVVCKSDGNSTHDGEIIHCPIGPESVKKGVVYNIAVNNVDGQEVIDNGIIFIGDVLDFFYEKRRPIEHRFSNKNSTVRLRQTSECFSVEEISLIRRFCAAMNADYGELDVLRDAESGRMFIVDFAKTPAGPPNGLSRKDVKRAIEDMSIAFLKNIVNRAVVRDADGYGRDS